MRRWHDRPVTLAGYAHLLTAARRLQWDADAVDLR
ncbi:MAG: hypothetical protein JWM31_2751, partial [Solirubrobacterales bacterium]|nr:hypothetical protein [Solirubrobacterales bacterium]